MKITKGNFGYLRSQKKREILRTLLFFGISFLVFVTGWITTGVKANLLTIVAMLGMLPASKSLVGMILFLRAKNCSEEIYRKTREQAGDLPILYELVLTSYDKNFPISSITYKNNILCGYSESEKFDIAAAKKHIEGMMKQNGHRPELLLFKEFSAYANKLKLLQQTEESEKDKNTEAIFNLLKAISI